MAEESPEAKMPTAEERVSVLENRSEEHSRRMAEIREMYVRLDQRLDQTYVRLDDRITHLEQRITHLEQKMDRRFDNVDTRFNWVIGVQVALLLAVIGALLR